MSTLSKLLIVKLVALLSYFLVLNMFSTFSPIINVCMLIVHTTIYRTHHGQFIHQNKKIQIFHSIKQFILTCQKDFKPTSYGLWTSSILCTFVTQLWTMNEFHSLHVCHSVMDSERVPFFAHLVLYTSENLYINDLYVGPFVNESSRWLIMLPNF